MIVNLPVTDSDDSEFFEPLNGMIANIIEKYHPKEVYFIQIDNWFDHKWLRFSGKGVVAFHGSPLTTSALDEFYQEKVTFPPFNPKRVLKEFAYKYVDGNYSKWPNSRKIHKEPKFRPVNNLQNRMSSFTDSGIFFWFSSNTHSNGQASVMCYNVSNGVVESWYTSFRKHDKWEVHRVKGIEEEVIQHWFPLNV
jgi:hypothetical protein